MRKALLFIKVVLLLATFVGTSSTHASKVGSHNLLAVSFSDSHINFGHQPATEDDSVIVTHVDLPSLISESSPAIHWYLLVVIKRQANKPFARAPPVNFLV
jgi:hypothetical protein